jgi:hypothetical protein
MKNLEELTAALLRKAATGHTDVPQRTKDGPSASRDMVRRLMTKSKFREEDLGGSLDHAAASLGLDTAGLDLALTRAKAAVLKKTTGNSEDLSLSARMTSAVD